MNSIWLKDKLSSFMIIYGIFKKVNSYIFLSLSMKANLENKNQNPQKSKSPAVQVLITWEPVSCSLSRSDCDLGGRGNWVVVKVGVTEKAASNLLYGEFCWVVDVVEVVKAEMNEVEVVEAVTTISGTEACVSVRLSWEVSGLVKPSLSSLNSSWRGSSNDLTTTTE